MIFSINVNALYTLRFIQKLILQQRYEDVISKLYNKGLYKLSAPFICQYATFYKPYLLSELINSISEENRTISWNLRKDVYVKQIPFLAYHLKTDTLVSMALDASIFSKGIFLNTSMTMKQAITDSNPSLLDTYYKFEKLNLEYEQKQNGHEKEADDKTKELKTQRDSLRSLLWDEMPYFCDVEESLSITWKDIQSVLEEKDVAIDFVEIPMDSVDNIYVALVVKKSYHNPKMVYLFSKSELPLSSHYPIVDESIAYDKIWSPLDSLLQGSENIYFSPTGILNNIAIEYLPDKRELPISWLYNMHRLSNLKELAVENDSTTSLSRVGLIGGLDYDMFTTTGKHHTKKSNNRGAEAVCSYLPSSLSEVQNIKDILNERAIAVDLFTENSMPEDSISRFQKKRYDILHFATHGFYLDGQTDKVNNLEFNALSHSGLALSGANEYLPLWVSDRNYTSTSSDNILTSLEISKMNLTEVNLVVLSACVSGLGLAGQDGQYGLQRAFKKAGVKSQLVSLWDIDDEATSIFFTSFYRYYIQLKDMFRALKLAQQALCRAKNGRYNHPRYWATFILLDGMDQTKSKISSKKKKMRFQKRSHYIFC